MPKVSIIVAVYNVEPYLRRSMDCLMNQTMEDLEFICIDDCSTDGSLAILREYEAKDPRFKIIASERNGGAAVARNKGLEVAKGEYLGFIDPDDAFDLNYYEELYKKAKEDDYDIVKCNRTTVNGNKVATSKLNEKIINNGIIYFNIEWTTAIYRASLVFDNNIRFPDDIRKGQDSVFLYQIILRTNKYAIIDNVNYYYYKRDDSLNAQNIPLKSVLSGLKAMDMICGEINNSDLYDRDYNTYMKIYATRLMTMLKSFLFRSRNINSKFLCANYMINNYYKCKDVEGLKKIFKPKWMLPYIKKKQCKKLALLFMLYRTKQELYNYSPEERIFSLKNIKIENEKYKAITFLGLRIEWKQKEDKIEQKSNSIDLNIKKQQKRIDECKKLIIEQKEQTDELIKQINEQENQINGQKVQIDEQKKQIDVQKVQIAEQKKQIDELIKQIDVSLATIKNDVAITKDWCGNFYKDVPDVFPVSLTDNEKEMLKNYYISSKNYLEFGAGGSTFIALLNSNCKIFSIDSDNEWLNYMRTYKLINTNENERLAFKYVDIGNTGKWGRPINDLERDNYPNYSVGVYQNINPEIIDLVLVDGRFRVACVLGVILNCSRDIKILVHDYTEREYYHVIEEFLDIVEKTDTLYSFRIKDNIDINRVKQLYEEYKYQFE